jgi:hypothetical protein
MMRTEGATSRAIVAVVLLAICTVLLVTGVADASAPTKLLPESQFGAKVNKDGANFCLTSECEPGGGQAVSGTNAVPGGFGSVLRGVALGANGDLYAADIINNRVQVLKPEGEFVLMFGKKVNETTGGNVCTEVEIESVTIKAKCKAGEGSVSTEGFKNPAAVAVDPASGNVYVSELGDQRVDEYTAGGQFVLTIGKKVNKNGSNLCVASEATECQGAERASTGSTEHGAFSMASAGEELASGGPDDFLYVGDEHRVQEFKADGTWVEEIRAPLEALSSASSAKVRALTVDQATGDLSLTYTTEPQLANTIFEFNASGSESGRIVLSSHIPTETVTIEGIALDLALPGTMTVVENEKGHVTGSLIDMSTSGRITEFNVFSSVMPSLTFNSSGQMYGASPSRKEIVGYGSKLVAELVPGGLACQEEGTSGTSAIMECALNGDVNPENVAQTEAWFSWGRDPSLSEAQETLPQPVVGNALQSLSPAPTVKGLRPDETVYEKMNAYDEYVKEPEPPIASEETSHVTPIVPPRIETAPANAFVHSDSAVLEGAVNPENAPTTYWFEYGICEGLASCPQAARSEPGESRLYGDDEVSRELTGLSPATVYHARLVAENGAGQRKEGPETTFTTAPAPAPSAATGGHNDETPTSAVIYATVDPAGVPTSYAFEVGVYEGANTQYGVVFVGSPGMGLDPVTESLQLTGLQPGTTYAYRVSITSGYIPGESHTQQAAVVLFTTPGLPSAIALPPLVAQLPVPNIAFPSTTPPPKKHKAKRSKKHHSKKGKRRKGKKARRGAVVHG